MFSLSKNKILANNGDIKKQKKGISKLNNLSQIKIFWKMRLNLKR